MDGLGRPSVRCTSFAVLPFAFEVGIAAKVNYTYVSILLMEYRFKKTNANHLHLVSGGWEKKDKQFIFHATPDWIQIQNQTYYSLTTHSYGMVLGMEGDWTFVQSYDAPCRVQRDDWWQSQE